MLTAPRSTQAHDLVSGFSVLEANAVGKPFYCLWFLIVLVDVAGRCATQSVYTDTSHDHYSTSAVMLFQFNTLLFIVTNRTGMKIGADVGYHVG